MHLVFVTAITKNYEYSKWIAWWHQAITFHADSEVQWYWSEVNFTGGANQLKINILPIKITKEIYFHKKNFSINTTIDISLLALSVKHHDIPGCAY